MVCERCVCAVFLCVELTTGAKHNNGDEKNMAGLAHSRASRYHSVTNRKRRPNVSWSGPVHFRVYVRCCATRNSLSAGEDARVGAPAFVLCHCLQL